MKVDKTITLEEGEFKSAIVQYLLDKGEIQNNQMALTDLDIEFMNGSVPETDPRCVTHYKLTVKNFKY